MADKVPVVDLSGRRLTPCSPEKAAQNVRDGLATLGEDGILHLNYRPMAHRRIYRMVKKRDGWRCAWCGGAGSTLDHVIPICWGGATSLTNCVIACRSCNHSRNNALPTTFVEWTGFRPIHPVIRHILADEPDAIKRAQQSLWDKPLASCLSREEAQVWVALHADHIEWSRPDPPEAPVTRVKSDPRPFHAYFVP